MIVAMLLSQINTYLTPVADPRLALVVASITAGNTSAQLWTLTSLSTDMVICLWDKGNNVFYRISTPSV